jgi:hypothetical protein
MFPKKEVYYIKCSTSCSHENFDLGFFDNSVEPNEIIEQWGQDKKKSFS